MTSDRSDRENAQAASAGGPAPFESTEPLLDLAFDQDSLYAMRSAVAAHASSAGMPEDRVHDLVAAAHELAANAVLHGAGSGRLRLWHDNQALHCRVSDEGPAVQPHDTTDTGSWERAPGSGLWLTRQLADQMNLQTGRYGTIATISLAIVPPGRTHGREGHAT
jgi:anti-sigma regulatory factor (Ser/Thr protein kinase)